MIAATAVSIVPWPLNMITGSSACTGLDPLEYLHAVESAALEPDVEQHQPGRPALDLAQRLVAVGSPAGTVALVLEDGCRPPRGWRPRRRRSDTSLLMCLARIPRSSVDQRRRGPVAAPAARAHGQPTRTGKLSRTKRASCFTGKQLDRSAVFLHDLLDDGKAQARTLGPGRDVGLEQALAIGRKPLAIVLDLELHRRFRAPRRGPRSSTAARRSPFRQRIDAVLQQIR